MPAEERSIRVEGVVLRHSEFGEADRLLTVFTRERGKLKVVAKGVRKMRSRKAGHLEPFMRTSMQLAYGRDLWVVTQVETVDAFQPIREDLLRTGYASYVIELLDRFTFEEGAYQSLYQLLIDTLHRLSEQTDGFLTVRYYEIRLLDYIGYRPELFQCVDCREEIKPQDQFFSALQGGVLCPRCGTHSSDALPISLQALKYLRHFQRSTFKEANRAELNPSARKELEYLMQRYISFLLERNLNSPAFIREVRKD
ncbi:MAG: DNA repair protein RecO [Anaerolineaceae bacterium]